MSSPFSKSKLKAARDALGKKQYEAARDAASQVLDYEPDNYNAHVFLGLAYLELGQHGNSEQFYRKAVELKPDQILAWQGITRLYERKQEWDAFASALEKMMRVYSAGNDTTKTAETLQKLIDTRRQHGTGQQIIGALAYLLPDSPVYDTLSNLPPPDPTNPTSTTTFSTQVAIDNSLPVIQEIISLTEQGEETFIRVEYDKRRTRLGAPPPDQLKKEIGLEVWKTSKLPSLYQEVLNHPQTSDELRRSTETKVVHYKQRHFYALPVSDPGKVELGSELDELVQGIVAIGIPDELSWTMFLEGMDKDTISGYGLDYLRQYTQLLPNTPLAHLLKGYFLYTGIPMMEEDEKGAPTNPVSDDHEPFDIIMDAFTSNQDMVLATQVVADVYLQEQDYPSVIHVAESGLELVRRYEQNTGRKLRLVCKAFNVVLATALVHLYPPKHHPRALGILDDVLKQDPDNVDALIARGYVMQFAEKWDEATMIFCKAAELIPVDTPKRARAREEGAWCLSRTSLEDGLCTLKEILSDLDGEWFEPDKARCLWRIGKCFWDMGDEFREEAYTYFIQSLKCDREYAPSYTSLGIYYSEFATPPDPMRASKCFQKAFELDPREAEAARRLAEGFADEREWDLVEVVARRTIDGEGGLDAGIQKESGVVAGRYLPTNAWAWKALGVVELSRRNYARSIEAFQVALRADQEDQICWLRLGEAYSKGGRHAAALKALERAHELKPDDWMCAYLMGEVQMQTGKLAEALDSFKSVLKMRPMEIGALMSLAQTELALARQEWLGGFLARAEQTFISAITTSILATRASSGYGGIAWKVIADALLGLSKATLFTDEDFIRDTLVQITTLIKGRVSKRIAHVFGLRPLQDDTPATGSHALEVAVICYDYRATVTSTNDIAMGSALFDLGMILYLWAKGKENERNPALEAAASLVKEALHKEPSNPTYWTVLANIYFVDKPKTSQHAYIRALELDSKNVVTWAHLGLLYLYHNDVELANEALLKAQILDPDYTLAWVGQALVATTNGRDEHCRALLEHAVGLTADVPIADLEFAARVFLPFTGPARASTSAQEEVLPALAVLDRYVKRYPTDACALHLLGLVYERLGHQERGAEWISRAIALLETAYEETEDPVLERQFTIAHANLARLKVSMRDYAGALESFETALGLLPEHIPDDSGAEVRILRVQALFGSGLAHFRLGDLQNAMTTFQAALDTAGENDTLRGHVTVLLAQSMWAIGTDEFRESAKTLLLDSITTDPENLMAINTLAGMGILTADDGLVDAALSEIQSLPIERQQELDPRRDVTYLLVQHHLGQGDIKQANRIVQKALHVEPSNLHIRRDLASLTLQQGNKRGTRAILEIDSSVCSIEEAKETLALAAIANDEDGNALRYAQKAIMLGPGNIMNWKMLAYVRARDVGS